MHDSETCRVYTCYEVLTSGERVFVFDSTGFQPLKRILAGVRTSSSLNRHARRGPRTCPTRARPAVLSSGPCNRFTSAVSKAINVETVYHRGKHGVAIEKLPNRNGPPLLAQGSHSRVPGAGDVCHRWLRVSIGLARAHFHRAGRPRSCETRTPSRILPSPLLWSCRLCCQRPMRGCCVRT